MAKQDCVKNDLLLMFEKVFNVSLTDDKQEMILSEYRDFLNSEKFYYIMPRGIGKTAKIQRINFYHMYRIMRGTKSE